MAGKNRKSKNQLNKEVVVRNGEVILYDANGDSKDISALSVDNSDNLVTTDTAITFLRGRSKYTYGVGTTIDPDMYETREEAQKAHKILLGLINSLCDEMGDLTQRVTALEEQIEALLNKPYVKVSPSVVQFISQNSPVTYTVKSNTTWEVN